MFKPFAASPPRDCVHCSMKLVGCIIDPDTNPFTMIQ